MLALPMGNQVLCVKLNKPVKLVDGTHVENRENFSQ
jgi:hypothetical protein